MKKPVKFSPEVRERAVRMVLESRGGHPSQWSAIESMAAKIGCVPQTLHGWLRQHERDTGQRSGPTTAGQQRLKELAREVKALRRANEAERPNQLWVSDFAYVSTWQGWHYVAFVIDVFARCIVGWRVSSSMHTDFVPDALEQALWTRQPVREDALIHHSDRGSQYISIRYSERLAEAGIEPSAGNKGQLRQRLG